MQGSMQHIEGFIQTYQFWYQTLKDELGEDPNLIQQATQPRVTSENVQFSQQQAVYATDYMYNAYAECMKMTAKKVSCLLKDSIAYGSKAYRDIVKEDVADRVFTTDIKFLPTDQEIAQYDAMIQNAVMSNPDLTMFLNQFQAMEMVKQDVKLAWLYYNNCLKKMAGMAIRDAATKSTGNNTRADTERTSSRAGKTANGTVTVINGDATEKAGRGKSK
jgi:hypothetical protein